MKALLSPTPHLSGTQTRPMSWWYRHILIVMSGVRLQAVCADPGVTVCDEILCIKETDLQLVAPGSSPTSTVDVSKPYSVCGTVCEALDDQPQLPNLVSEWLKTLSES